MDPLFQAKNYVELSLWECGREKCIPEKEFHFTPKDYHLFHYVSAGKGTFTIAGITYHLHRGDIFYVPPHVVPHYSPDKDDPWSYVWLGFAGAQADHYLAFSGLDIIHPVYHDETSALKEIFDDIANRYIDKGMIDVYCLGKAYELFGLMIEKGSSSEQARGIKESRLQSAKEFILNNYQFQISIEDIASNVGVSPNYLSAVFNELEKQTTKSYLTMVRMEKAKLYLATGQYLVKDVGQMIGYKNQLHFSGEFKKYTGKSPLKYGKSMEEQQNEKH